ncbi:D-allose ABC transporter ATP-binding protein AlsA [Symbiobacterium thermophilum]|uniref:Sugar ABC transporter ATP-binding protein n=1 Tax=Symbiobacterium thermophilum (strain DSM 24528 / JCM 14929 / IAM 14863 / T) TaxID=292459 RepID=Q67LX0_SYMTH|nr:D-allose ABC transporter ATP-binding protein AlsA [Symbiobacterium thermophilum]BAD41326.1 sugar ABC transporter ATP-binding protein [Symbiobacterium thermophilum IAM 14863]
MEPLVRMDHITKTFPGVRALSDITFDIRPGEVHVLLGENGAGKSTLMKILSGAYEPTSGTITVDGRAYPRLTPALSAKLGISIIYQELSVINELSIEENIFVGRLPVRKVMGVPVVDYAFMRQRTQELLDILDLRRSPETLVGDLSISEKQMVEIAKAVAFNARVIIMDEPTSSLTDAEVEKLFAIIRRLKGEGKGIVYISHKLKEILAIGDRITVLKDGTYVGTRDVQDVTMDGLVTMMVGRELKDKYQANTDVHRTGKVIFEVRNLTRRDGRVQDVSFALREGEVLGFAGLVGAGRSETMCAIYGTDPIRSGEIWLHGERMEIRSPYDALKKGIGLVTENRRETGFFPNFSIRRNVAIARQLKLARWGGLWGLVNERDEQKTAEKARADMQIKCASLEQNITELSGGNQQKVILGKWLAAGVKVLIFDEPTRGIDVGTKAEIYKLMRSLAESGIGVIVVSSELPELLSVCDRIIVMSEGRISAEFTAAEATEEKIVKAATVGAGASGGN